MVFEMSRMTQEDRVKLIQKLQDDVESFVAEQSRRARNKAEEEDERSIDEIVEELKSHPAFMNEVDWSKPLSEEMEGLIAMKYETEDPVARAESYREEGNDLFKKKDYRVAIDNYTEGIKSKSPNRLQNAILYTNRAAAQFRLGNYRSAFNDCIVARKFVPHHMKAIIKGALCCEKMNKHGDTMIWCDAGLMIESCHEELRKLKANARLAKSVQDRDERKKAYLEKKEQKATLKLIEAIKSRRIQLSTIPQSEEMARLNPTLLYDLDPVHPSGSHVHLDSDDVLHWPVFFLYPEYTQTDFVQKFCENDTFYDHLMQMFGPGIEPAGWDIESKYIVDDLQLYFEDKEDEILYPVSRHSTLLEVLQHKRYLVFKGTPAFIVLVKDSDFQKKYLKQNRVSR